MSNDWRGNRPVGGLIKPGDTDFSMSPVELHQAAHKSSDVDFDRSSQHHTLGSGPTQAAAGNHNHDASYVSKVGDLDWTPLSLLNSWIPHDTAGWGIPSYRKDGDFLKLKGLVRQPVAGQVAFTIAILGTGLIPLVYRMVVANTSSSPQDLYVTPTGLVYLPNAAGLPAGTWANLNLSVPLSN